MKVLTSTNSAYTRVNPHTVVIRVEHEIEINCRGGALFRPLWPVVRALRQRSADSQAPPYARIQMGAALGSTRVVPARRQL